MREAPELTGHLTSLDQGVGEDGETPLGDLIAGDAPIRGKGVQRPG